MSGNDNFFASKKDNDADGFGQDSDKEDNNNPFKTKIKSPLTVGLGILLFVGLFGLDSIASKVNQSKKKNKKIVSNDFVIDDSDIVIDFGSVKRDPDEYKGKQGFFRSFFCSGYQQSSFCK